MPIYIAANSKNLQICSIPAQPSTKLHNLPFKIIFSSQKKIEIGSNAREYNLLTLNKSIAKTTPINSKTISNLKRSSSNISHLRKITIILWQNTYQRTLPNYFRKSRFHQSTCGVCSQFANKNKLNQFVGLKSSVTQRSVGRKLGIRRSVTTVGKKQLNNV